MIRWRFGYSLLAVALAAASLGTAPADEVTVITEPEDPGVTIVTQPAPPATDTTKVTVVKESDADTQIVHEAVVGVDVPETAIVVKETPPEPKPEVMKVETRPAEDFVWVPGYWRWNAANNSYDWIPGTWRRSIPGLVWNPGHWQKTDDTGYVWISGHWSSRPAAETATTTTTTTVAEPDTDVIVVKEAPPTVKVETKPASPGEGYMWIPGYWEYRNGEYAWVDGRWERPPAEEMVWVPGQWVDTGAGYVYVSGHWDYPEERRTVVVTRED